MTNREYLTYGSDGKIRRFDHTGRVVDTWDRPADEPVEPARVDRDSFRFFYGAINAISLSLVGFALIYLAQHLCWALVR